MVVSVEAVIAPPTSDVPTTALSFASFPALRWRTMDSKTTMALSTNIPIPRANPPRDIILSDVFERCSGAKVAITHIGIVMAIINVLPGRLKNKNNTMMASSPPVIQVLITSSIAWRIKSD